MWHPVNGKEWQEFDKSHPQFANEVRNIRLGLAVDGFNLFDNMSLSHSMRPVVLSTYNLPPSMGMKHECLKLTLLIPRPQSLEKNMDVFLRPLIDNRVFRMRAALLWTINDFSATSSLSRWSGQGYKASFTCDKDNAGNRKNSLLWSSTFLVNQASLVQ